MKTETDIRTDDSRAIETASLAIDGHVYTAGGFMVDLESGVMVCYPATLPARPGNTHDTVAFHTWSGETIMTGRVTGRSRGFHGSRLTHYGARFLGHYWHGKGSGDGMILRLYRGAAL